MHEQVPVCKGSSVQMKEALDKSVFPEDWCASARLRLSSGGAFSVAYFVDCVFKERTNV